jgi:hypothetical protein
MEFGLMLGSAIGIAGVPIMPIGPGFRILLFGMISEAGTGVTPGLTQLLNFPSRKLQFSLRQWMWPRPIVQPAL